MRTLRLGAVLAAALLACQSASAQQPINPVGPSGTSLLPADLGFVLHAAESGNAEIALGKLAGARATDSEIKQFGNRMAMAHSAANQQLAVLAATKGVTPPDEPGATADVIYRALERAPQERFNVDYMAQQVAAHAVAVASFQHCASSCIDPQIKQFAAENAPEIEGHLEAARGLLAKALEQAS